MDIARDDTDVQRATAIQIGKKLEKQALQIKGPFTACPGKGHRTI
jgi:hypothetical protein